MSPKRVLMGIIYLLAVVLGVGMVMVIKHTPPEQRREKILSALIGGCVAWCLSYFLF